MAALAFIAPVLPGITHDDLKRFAQEATGARREKHIASRQPSGGSGITTELAWLQQTPQGEVIIVYLEGDDPVRWLHHFSASQDPHDVWFKQQCLALFGVDLNQSFGPVPELFFEWRR
jgi:hypothetical protein